MRVKIDQCAVDFRHMSLQTAALSDSVSSTWCETCILFFKNLSKKKKNPSITLKKISKQASNLSGNFKSLADWCSWLAAHFHSVKALGESKSEEYAERVEQQKLRAMSVGSKGTMHASNTRYNFEKIIIMVKSIRDLLQYLGQIEQKCEAIAAFWQLESDKFASFCPLVESVSDFFDIGLCEEVTQDQLEWLRERKTELKKYHTVMTAVTVDYNLPTAVEPSQLPSIELPTLNVTLQ